MDEEVKKLCDDLCTEWVKSNTNTPIRMYEYTLSGRAENKLASLGNEVGRLRREAVVLKTESETWKQCYLEQVRENVLMQASILKGDK
jgi:hypothetical protein